MLKWPRKVQARIFGGNLLDVCRLIPKLCHGGTPKSKKIVLVGTSGAGKSTLGNALLGRDPTYNDKERRAQFETCPLSKSCTLTAAAIKGSWLGDKTKPVKIIDTPGHGDGEGRDFQLRESVVENVRKEVAVDAIVWVKNSASPRFDKQDMEFFQILKEMYGPGFVGNLAVVLTRYSNDPAARRRRERAGAENSLSDIIEDLRDSLGDREGMIPVFAIDAMYDPEDPHEARAFAEATASLWKTIQSFSQRPVHDIKQVEDRLGRLAKQEAHLQEQIEKLERAGRQQDKGKIMEMKEDLKTVREEIRKFQEVRDRQKNWEKIMDISEKNLPKLLDIAQDAVYYYIASRGIAGAVDKFCPKGACKENAVGVLQNLRQAFTKFVER